MSSRQRKRLGKLSAQSRLDEIVLKESESEEEVCIDVPAFSVRTALGMSSSDEESDAETYSSLVPDTDRHDTAEPHDVASTKVMPTRKNISKSAKAKKASVSVRPSEIAAVKPSDDTAYSDDLFETLILDESSSDQTFSHRIQLFKVDPHNLDIDNIMKKRFGRLSVLDSETMPHGKPKSRVLKSSKKLLFGNQKHDWTKPPVLSGGGYGLSPTAGPKYDKDSNQRGIFWFEMRLSEEYLNLNDQYTLVQNSGDANRLVMFLSQYPYHLEGLLQLCIVFARMGQMDRAADLVRRALFCMECIFPDVFRLCCDSTVWARMDPTVHHNSTMFAALFRHMQITGMLGCPSLAADIAKILLSLCPEGDPFHVLLALDHYLVSAGKLDQILNWTNAPRGCSQWDSILTSPHTKHWNCCVEIGQSPFTQALSEISLDATESVTPLPSPDAPKSGSASALDSYTLEDLPNWWFSLALAAFNHELTQMKKSAAVGKPQDMADPLIEPGVSTLILRVALIRYPCFLLALQKSKKSGIEGKSLSWRAVLSHPYFESSSSDGVIDHILSIYVEKSGTLWNREEVHKWLLEAATTLSEQQSIVRNQSFLDRINASSKIQKYSGALLEDFMEDFPRFPPEANPLDPQFADPRALARRDVLRNMDAGPARHDGTRGLSRRARAALLAQGVDGDGGIERIVDQHDHVNEEALLRETDRLRAFGINISPQELLDQIQILRIHRAEGQDAVAGNIDLEAPLMQLFLQTLMPWYVPET